MKKFIILDRNDELIGVVYASNQGYAEYEAYTKYGWRVGLVREG